MVYLIASCYAKAVIVLTSLWLSVHFYVGLLNAEFDGYLAQVLHLFWRLCPWICGWYAAT